MHLCISGFLIDDTHDDSIKFEFDIDSKYNEKIMKLHGHKTLNAMAAGDWKLTTEQVEQLSQLLGSPFPTDLNLFISLER